MRQVRGIFLRAEYTMRRGGGGFQNKYVTHNNELSSVGPIANGNHVGSFTRRSPVIGRVVVITRPSSGRLVERTSVTNDVLYRLTGALRVGPLAVPVCVFAPDRRP